MATLVFSAVGTMAGGPIGGAVGSLVGSQVDAALFGAPGRQVGRLKELEVTTSSYGQPLLRHFGRMRVAGQIIWATDLVEHDEVLGGGKGSASATGYSYSVSFAVALASRPILEIGRIWADGKLLRGAAGDLKAAGTLRIHTGQGDQDRDPLLFAAVGDRCPAYRGLAYAVFEDLDLSGFYNRIPSLTFEIVADESFDLSAILDDVIEDADAAAPLDGIVGFSNEGPLAESLAVLDQVFPLDVDCAGERLVLRRDRLQPSPLPLGEATMAVDDGEFGAATGFSRHRAPAKARNAPALRYYEPARDYLPGLQYPSGRPARGEPAIIELPAALEAIDARMLVERTARRLDWSRERLSWRTAELDPAVAPGTRITLPGLAGVWRVREWEWRDTGIEITAERAVPPAADDVAPLVADAGRGHAQPDLPSAPTVLTAFELPYDPAAGPPGTARPFAAASSPQPNWTGAALYADHGDGALVALGPSGRSRSAIGRAQGALGAASPLLFDRASSLVVRLIDPAMQLACADARQLAEGANLALIGQELVQFASAAFLGGVEWQLGGFVRGCGGTESAIAGHGDGEAFVLLDRRIVGLDAALLGTAEGRSVVAIGLGDAAEVRAPVALAGITLRPLAPVHPRRTILPDGSWRIEWTRRARGIQPWRDGVEVPLVEDAESYLITYGPPDDPLAAWMQGEKAITLPPDLRGELAARAPGQWLRVAQQGTHALSSPLALCTLD